MAVGYTYSNESLDAVIAGLEPERNDVILAVCGSGDQAIALSEYAGKVFATDINAEQLLLAMKRVQMLKQGKYDGFLHPTLTGVFDGIANGKRLKEAEERVLSQRNAYFTQPGKLDAIRASLDHLEISLEPEDIIPKAMNETGHTKVYLSNAIGFCCVAPSEVRQLYLENIASMLPQGGLIYVSNDDVVRSGAFKLPSNLSVDKRLTKAARDVESKDMAPGVYRRA